MKKEQLEHHVAVFEFRKDLLFLCEAPEIIEGCEPTCLLL